jgi:hypothetical protein
MHYDVEMDKEEDDVESDANEDDYDTPGPNFSDDDDEQLQSVPKQKHHRRIPTQNKRTIMKNFIKKLKIIFV